MKALPSRKLTPVNFIAQLPTRLPTTFAVGLTVLTIAAAPSAGDLLQFHRASISAGEFWRLATCHFTHWNGEHLCWDLLMFVVLGAACELRNPSQMRGCVALAACAVAGLVLFCCPQIQEYRGLSGIDTALFTMLAIELMRDARRDRSLPLAIMAGGFVAGFAAKAAYEAATGQTIFVNQDAAGFMPLVWDHLAAGVAGATIALGAGTRRNWTKLPESRRMLPDGLEPSTY